MMSGVLNYFCTTTLYVGERRRQEGKEEGSDGVKGKEERKEDEGTYSQSFRINSVFYQ